MVYEPQEDSYLLRSSLPKQLTGKKVLEIGPGSGIISIACAQRGGEVIAVDIDPQAVAATRKAALDEHVTVVVCEGDMFEPVQGEVFDLIVCNAPYLPNEPKDPDVALDGGPEGWEFIDRLLAQTKDYLAKEGSLYLVFSSHTKPDKVALLLQKYGFTSTLLAKKEMGFFEELFIVELIPDGN